MRVPQRSHGSVKWRAVRVSGCVEWVHGVSLNRCALSLDLERLVLRARAHQRGGESHDVGDLVGARRALPLREVEGEDVEGLSGVLAHPVVVGRVQRVHRGSADEQRIRRVGGVRAGRVQREAVDGDVEAVLVVDVDGQLHVGVARGGAVVHEVLGEGGAVEVGGAAERLSGEDGTRLHAELTGELIEVTRRTHTASKARQHQHQHHRRTGERHGREGERGGRGGGGKGKKRERGDRGRTEGSKEASGGEGEDGDGEGKRRWSRRRRGRRWVEERDV